MTNILAWIFGVCVAVIMLGSLLKRRRDHLVTTLKTHVEKKMGSSVADASVAENRSEKS